MASTIRGPNNYFKFKVITVTLKLFHKRKNADFFRLLKTNFRIWKLFDRTSHIFPIIDIE